MKTRDFQQIEPSLILEVLGFRYNCGTITRRLGAYSSHNLRGSLLLVKKEYNNIAG